MILFTGATELYTFLVLGPTREVWLFPLPALVYPLLLNFSEIRSCFLSLVSCNSGHTQARPAGTSFSEPHFCVFSQSFPVLCLQPFSAWCLLQIHKPQLILTLHCTPSKMERANIWKPSQSKQISPLRSQEAAL